MVRLWGYIFHEKQGGQMPQQMMRKIRHVAQSRFYPYLARRASDDVQFMNWAYEEDPPMALPLDPVDEPNRYPINLYHSTAMQAGGLAGKRVLEVGCGHGGGASYLTRTMRPASYIGLDKNPAGIAFCHRRHRVPGLEFARGDAEDLPFRDGSFDAVINVESSHCYPNFDRFLSEVARVLQPGGALLYTDMREQYECARWDADLAAAPLRIMSRRDIDGDVLRGIERNTGQWDAAMQSLGLLARVVIPPTNGSQIHRQLESGTHWSYRMYRLTKAG